MIINDKLQPGFTFVCWFWGLVSFDGGAWCEGYYLLSRAFYFFAGWESDDAGALLLNGEDTGERRARCGILSPGRRRFYQAWFERCVERERESSNVLLAMERARSSLIMNQCVSRPRRGSGRQGRRCLWHWAFRVCLKRNGRSGCHRSPVIACSTSAAMMVLRFWLMALVSAALTTAADRVLSLVRKSVTASLPMRRWSWLSWSFLRICFCYLGICHVR